MSTTPERATLRILTFDKPEDQPACAGTMTCACPRCQMERAQLIARGVRPSRQPWQPKRQAA